MSEQNIPLLGSMYSLAFIRGLIVHGVLRANIKDRHVEQDSTRDDITSGQN